MTDMHSCPVDGCDYGPKPLDSVCGHYSGKKDGEHQGDWYTARDILTDGSDSDSETVDSTPSESGDGDVAGSVPSDGGGNPTMGGREAVSKPSSPAEGGRSHAPDEHGPDDGCIDCGSELVDFTDLTSGEYHTINGQNVYVAGDYVCSQCGEWFTV